MERREKRQQAVRDAKINMILQGALKAFSKLGFHQTRLEDIAGAAGFSKTALYYYYNNKEEIFMDLVIRESEKLLEKIRNTIREASTTVEAILCYGTCVLEVFGEHFNIMNGMLDFESGVAPNPEQFHKQKKKMLLMKENVEEFERIIVDLLQDGQQRGDVRSDLDTRILSDYINALFRGIMFRWGKDRRLGDVASEIGNLSRFLEPVLTAGAAKK
jgi:AcrR family transcriptional regulator